jgi:hypothetical protein
MKTNFRASWVGRRISAVNAPGLCPGVWTVLTLVVAATSSGAMAQGIPEPSLVMYGVVRNVQDPDRLRVVIGNLTWIFQPTAGGPSFAVAAALTNINDQFSYVLRVPCETDIPGFPVSTNALRLGASYTRGTVFLNATNPMVLAEPLQASFSLTTTSRGRVERVDLNVSSPLEDLDGNGLSDGWERLYFGQTGVDPFADPDGDGLNNRDEFKAGTNPADAASQFRFIRITPQSGGMLVEWSSVTNRAYSILRSSEVLDGYQLLSGNRPATPPVNSFFDATAVPPGNYFYLLRLQE